MPIDRYEITYLAMFKNMPFPLILGREPSIADFTFKRRVYIPAAIFPSQDLSPQILMIQGLD